MDRETGVNCDSTAALARQRLHTAKSADRDTRTLARHGKRQQLNVGRTLVPCHLRSLLRVCSGRLDSSLL